MLRYVRLTDSWPVHLDRLFKVHEAEKRLEQLFRGHICPGLLDSAGGTGGTGGEFGSGAFGRVDGDLCGGGRWVEGDMPVPEEASSRRSRSGREWTGR